MVKHGQIKAWNLREVVDNDGESCAQERLQLSGEELGPLGAALPGNLGPLGSITISGGKALSQPRNQNVVRAPGAPTAWPAYIVSAALGPSHSSS